jgi:hypothetical protein
MTCKCGAPMRRTETPTESGNRITLLECGRCYRFEREVRSRSGSLVRWSHGVNKRPTGVQSDDGESKSFSSGGGPSFFERVRNEHAAAK